MKYGRLVDIGRKIVDDHVPRPAGDRLARIALKEGLTSPLFGPAMRIGQMVRPLLPQTLQNKVPPRQQAGHWPSRSHSRKVLLLEGCVQPSMAPNINTATARVLDALGIETLRPAAAGCCGAIRYHLNDHDGGLADARRNVMLVAVVQHAENMDSPRSYECQRLRCAGQGGGTCRPRSSTRPRRGGSANDERLAEFLPCAPPSANKVTGAP